MDEEAALDFKALRAKFQEKDILLKQPKHRPSLPEKPKVLSPPQSPSHYLPAGARPCFPTTLTQTLDGKNPYAPGVVFKDDKKDSKKPLIEPTVKAKEKSEGKSKVVKDKSTKESKEKLNANGKTEPPEGKKKKKATKDKKGTAELVPVTTPPKASTQKKKGFLGFKKPEKKELPEVPTDPILDAPSPYLPGPEPLAPVTFGKTMPKLSMATQPLEAATPPTSTYSDDSALLLLPSFIPPPPESPSSPEVPLEIPDIPAPEVPPIEITDPPEIETPSLPVSLTPVPATATPTASPTATPTPPSSAPSPQSGDRSLIPHSPPAASTPSPPAETGTAAAGAVGDLLDFVPAGEPVPQVSHLPSSPPSPKMEKPFSPLSALERAEVKSPSKKMSSADQRVYNALEKARKKVSRPTSNTSLPVISPPEEPPPLPGLPQVDYQAGNVKAVQVNGHSSPVFGGIVDEGTDSLPELLVVPPPPPRKPLPDLQTLAPAPEKHARSPSIDLTAFLPPADEDNAIELPAPPEFSEPDSSVETPEQLEWGNGDYAGAGNPYEHINPQTQLSNGLATPVEEADAVPPFGAMFREIPELEKNVNVVDSPATVCEDNQPNTASQLQDGTYEYGESVYEDVVSPSNKKKTDRGRKRKGPPKNPYDETSQPMNEDKTKTGRFNKADKKTVETPDEKELKKKEKQRLEKEKKELKERKEREKREQKEKEKKESEMKKKFKITGQEEAIYQANVTVTSKGRKNDLPITCGEVVSIVKTNNCPKGKWLARNSSNNYGYIAVDHVALNIKEMMELGKKTTMSKNNSSLNAVMPDGINLGNRTSNHYPLSPGSFSDDSDEWTGDEDDTPTSPIEPLSPQSHSRTLSMPEIGNKELNVIHQHSHSDMTTDAPQAGQEALHKLTTFFSPKPVAEKPAAITVTKTNPVLVERETVSPPNSSSTQEVDLEPRDMIIIPPPDLYADIFPVK